MATEVQITGVNFAPQVLKYMVFKGPRRIDVEVAIAKENRQKASVAGLMQFRLDALKSGYRPAIELAWGRWYDASNWVAYWDGKVKIGEDFEMPENPKMENGVLVLTEKQFDDLKEAMSIGLARELNIPTQRALVLDDGVNLASVIDRFRYLDGSYARLVGVSQGFEARVVA